MRKKGKRTKSPRSKEDQNLTATNNSAAGLESDASREIEEYVQGLPSEQRAQLAMHLIDVVKIEQTFIGPLPPPDDFAKYERILPSAAERILAMAEKEQQMREDGQKGMLHNDNKRISTATFLGLAVIAVAGLATWKGYGGIAILLGLSGLASMIVRQLFAAWLNPREKPKQ